VDWHTLWCDLKSHWGRNTSAASQPQSCLQVDQSSHSWSLARNKPLPNHNGWLPVVAPVAQRETLERESHTRRACAANSRAGLKSIESELMDDTVRVLMHVPAGRVTCGVTVANSGVLGLLWNDCYRGIHVQTCCRGTRWSRPTGNQPLNHATRPVCFISDVWNEIQICPSDDRGQERRGAAWTTPVRAHTSDV